MAKKIKSKFIVFGVVILAMAAFVVFYLDYGTSALRSWHSIVEQKTLRVVTDYNSVNYSLIDGMPCGFNYDLVKMFADANDLSLEITIESDIHNSIRGLKRGEYDILLRNIPVTADTRKRMSLSDPIVSTHLVLVQLGRMRNKGEKPIRFVHDLSGEEVFVIDQSPYSIVLQHLNEELGLNINIVNYASGDAELLNAMVARGQIKYAACDALTASISKYYYPQLDVSLGLGPTQFIAWGLSDARGLKENIDRFIDSVKTENISNSLYKKYYK